jgi:hypothetical protein
LLVPDRLLAPGPGEPYCVIIQIMTSKTPKLLGGLAFPPLEPLSAAPAGGSASRSQGNKNKGLWAGLSGAGIEKLRRVASILSPWPTRHLRQQAAGAGRLRWHCGTTAGQVLAVGRASFQAPPASPRSYTGGAALCRCRNRPYHGTAGVRGSRHPGATIAATPVKAVEFRNASVHQILSPERCACGCGVVCW